MVEDAAPTPAPGFMPISKAARSLSVTEGRVRQLIKSGSLRASRVGDIWLVDGDSVDRRMALGPSGGRKLTPARAWALLYMADDRKAPWLDKSARYRVSTLLAERGLRALSSRLVDRGLPMRLRCHPSLLGQLRDDPRLMLTGATAAADLDLGLLAGEMVEAYVDDGALEKIRHEYHLQPSREPNVVLRPVQLFSSAWPIERYAPLPAIALDLLEDLDPRTRDLGGSLLDRLDR